MRRSIQALVLSALAACAVPAMVAPVVAADAAAKPAHYSVSMTLVGTLLADPAAVEILKRLVPSVYNNEMFQTMGKDQTLQAIQQYEPEALSDANLAKIQAEFDKIPAK
ncbi:MAG: hypothetical protein U1F39_05335 [Steroidobacteraceae bacterium]